MYFDALLTQRLILWKVAKSGIESELIWFGLDLSISKVLFSIQVSNQSKGKNIIELFATTFIVVRDNLLCLEKNLCAKIQHSFVSFFDFSLSAHCSPGEGLEMASSSRNIHASAFLHQNDREFNPFGTTLRNVQQLPDTSKVLLG